MDVSEFDFDLPSELIAQEPAAERGAARLLHVNRVSGVVVHTNISALPTLLRPGDLLVVNNTRVFPARLLGRRVPGGGTVECLLLARLSSEIPSGQCWEALMHPGQKLRSGARVIFDGARMLHGEVLERRLYGRRTVRLWTDDGSPVDDAVDAVGHVPLPPYIRRPDRAADRDRYQTTFACSRGSGAAPTAGLHFSDALLTALRDRGIETVQITLHVGYGTFQPMRVDRVENHHLEPERYEVEPVAAAAITSAVNDNRRVIAVGTTTTRTLETVARAHQGGVVAASGTTDLFIFPGFQFRVVQGLLTNFHLPRSSLSVLAAAFAGRERLLTAYREAIVERYRFYSYGDAMLIVE